MVGLSHIHHRACLKVILLGYAISEYCSLFRRNFWQFWPIGSSGGHEGRFSRDLLPVFSAGGPCEQFWHGQGCPVFDVVSSSISSVDHGVAHPPECPEGWLLRGRHGVWHARTVLTYFRLKKRASLTALDSQQRKPSFLCPRYPTTVIERQTGKQACFFPFFLVCLKSSLT